MVEPATSLREETETETWWGPIKRQRGWSEKALNVSLHLAMSRSRLVSWSRPSSPLDHHVFVHGEAVGLTQTLTCAASLVVVAEPSLIDVEEDSHSGQ